MERDRESQAIIDCVACGRQARRKPPRHQPRKNAKSKEHELCQDGDPRDPVPSWLLVGLGERTSRRVTNMSVPRVGLYLAAAAIAALSTSAPAYASNGSVSVNVPDSTANPDATAT